MNPLPNAGDLAQPNALSRVLEKRATSDGEIIFMLTDEHHIRLALNLLLNLDGLGLHHHLVVASSAEVCKSLWRRARRVNVSLGCGYSSFLQRGTSPSLDAGLAAYGIEDAHVYHLWWQRWFFLSEAVGLGYRVLSLDTDTSLRADPYAMLHGALAHHSLITGLDNDGKVRAFYFPPANVGFVYARGPPGSGCHWVLSESRRRLEQILSGQIIPHPSRVGSQQVVWDQDTFKDVIETAAFTPSKPSYRHAQLHCMNRVRGGPSAGRRAPKLAMGWEFRVEKVRFFSDRSIEPMPSAWLPLHLPPPQLQEQLQRPKRQRFPDELACNGTDAEGSDGRWDPWSDSAGTSLAGATRSGSFAAVPMWVFSTYGICPHGDVCDGRWAWRPSPYLIGHLVGVKAKFWILRMLGWWNYDAARPLPPPPGGSTTPEATDPAAATSSDGLSSEGRPDVFPASSEVRPLVLRGHRLHLTANSTWAHVKTLRQQLAHWALLALALGRRAVMPLVPCEIPTPELQPAVRDYSVLVKLGDRTLCDRAARGASARLKPSVPIEASVDAITPTREMRGLGNYTGLMDWPPKRADACCSFVPAIRCIDRYASRNELYEELLLTERDLGWLEAERAGTIKVVTPSRPLSVAALSDHAEARTLVLDLGVPAHGHRSDPMALLPTVEALEPHLTQAVKEARKRKHPPADAIGVRIGDVLRRNSARKCLNELLVLATTDDTDQGALQINDRWRATHLKRREASA